MSFRGYPLENLRYKYRQVMLQLIGLKAATALYNFQRRGNYIGPDLQQEIHYFKQYQDSDYDTFKFGRKAWGMVGYALVELMNLVEAMHEHDSISQVVELLKYWCTRALQSRTPIEMAALCSALVRIRAFGKLEEMPKEYHLSCGYYLSRGGYNRHAARFLVSGIYSHQRYMSGVLIWRYYVELWTVKMRQGQWGDVEIALSNTRKNLARELADGGNDSFEQAGETRDLKLTVASLLADCYTASGRFREAKDMLLSALESVHRQRVNLTQPIRIALKARLLNLEVELQDLDPATVTAIDLCQALRGSEAVLLAPQIVDWTLTEIQACVDVLIHEGLYRKADSVRRHYGTLVEQITYDPVADSSNQRRNEVYNPAGRADTITSPLLALESLNEPFKPALARDPSLASAPDNDIETVSPKEAAKDPIVTPMATSSIESVLKQGSETSAKISSVKSTSKSGKKPVQTTRKGHDLRETLSLAMAQRRKNSTMQEKLGKPPDYTPSHTEFTPTQ
ncbi:MAG: hypothetical protein Q9201_006625 [Fulgogasparrea decipioides]